jgi:SOS-response transcriptional repressor LexA
MSDSAFPLDRKKSKKREPNYAVPRGHASIEKGRLTKQQDYALRAIRWHQRQYGYTPTQAELSRMLKLESVQGCRSLLRALERKGHIYRVPNIWRGIRLVESLPMGPRDEE